jgi:hypothetical protein
MDSLNKIDFNDIRGKEIIFWSILLLNVIACIANLFAGGWFFVFLNGAAAIWMLYQINAYYREER